MFSYSDRTNARLAKVREALKAGFTTKSAQKDAAADISRAYDEIRHALENAVAAASPRPWLAEKRDATEAEWAAYIGFVYADGHQVPDYLHAFRPKHMPAIVEFVPGAVEPLSQLRSLLEWVKGAEVKPVESKSAKARREAAEVLSPASHNVIVEAVAPLKADAIARAEKEAIAIVERAAVELAKGGNDLNVVAPAGDYHRDNEYDRERKDARRALYQALTLPRSGSYMRQGPRLVDWCPPKAAEFINNAKADAALQYDAFVAKLALKVGKVSAASLAGNHVWGHSVLTVTKPEGVERWQTQMIVNVSKLGKLFNQWPTRKLK